MFEIHQGVAQTLIGPIFGEPGINLAHDLNSADIVEYTLGINDDRPGHFLCQTGPAFYARCRLMITTVAGATHCAFGFRKVEAYQADLDDYDEMFALDVVTGDIYGKGIDNGAGTDEDDTVDNWADGETHNLEVRVDADGVVTSFIDDVAPSTAPSTITFDSGEIVMPFFYQEQSGTTTAIVMYEWECGYQKG